MQQIYRRALMQKYSCTFTAYFINIYFEDNIFMAKIFRIILNGKMLLYSGLS